MLGGYTRLSGSMQKKVFGYSAGTLISAGVIVSRMAAISACAAASCLRTVSSWTLYRNAFLLIFKVSMPSYSVILKNPAYWVPTYSQSIESSGENDWSASFILKNSPPTIGFVRKARDTSIPDEISWTSSGYVSGNSRRSTSCASVLSRHPP